MSKSVTIPAGYVLMRRPKSKPGLWEEHKLPNAITFKRESFMYCIREALIYSFGRFAYKIPKSFFGPIAFEPGKRYRRPGHHRG